MKGLTLAQEFVSFRSSSFVVVLALVLSVIVGGCATTEGLSSRVTPYQGQLKQASVSEVEFISSMGTVGAVSTAGVSAMMVSSNLTPIYGLAVGGAAAGFAAGLSHDIDQERAVVNMKIMNQRFDELSLPEFIAETLRKSLVADLKESRLFESASQDNSQPQAELVAVVISYGFGPMSSLTYKTKPVLKVQAMLVTNPPFEIDWQVDKKGIIVDFEITGSDEHKLIWTKTVWTLSWKLPSYDFVAYLDDPDKTRAGFKAACQMVSDKLVKDLTEKLR